MSDDAPNFVETIICLAASRRFSGRCIAGKRIGDHSWFRPIAKQSVEEHFEYDGCYADGTSPKALDIISIPCIEKMPQGHQIENVLVDLRLPWKKCGRASWKDVRALVDRDANIWVAGDISSATTNYRVSEPLIDASAGSLRLIELDEIELEVTPHTLQTTNKIVWANFAYKGQKYRLMMTDPNYESLCLKRGVGKYRFQSVISCISLGQPHPIRGGEIVAHKFVASIITQKLADGLSRFFSVEWMKSAMDGLLH